MARHPDWLPIPDGARDGRRVEGGTRHFNAQHGAEMEFEWEDREWAKGFLLAGQGAVGLIMDGTMDLGLGEPTPVRAEHVLNPDTARELAYGLLVYATIAERRS